MNREHSAFLPGWWHYNSYLLPLRDRMTWTGCVQALDTMHSKCMFYILNVFFDFLSFRTHPLTAHVKERKLLITAWRCITEHDMFFSVLGIYDVYYATYMVITCVSCNFFSMYGISRRLVQCGKMLYWMPLLVLQQQQGKACKPSTWWIVNITIGCSSSGCSYFLVVAAKPAIPFCMACALIFRVRCTEKLRPVTTRATETARSIQDASASRACSVRKGT